MASPASPLRKRNASLELGVPASKMSKTENSFMKNKLQSEEDRNEKQSANRSNGKKGAWESSRISSAIQSTHLSGLHDALSVLDRVVHDDLPDLLDELDSAKLCAFHDMETEFREEDADEFVMCLSRRFPNICELRSTLIVSLHKSLRKCKPHTILLPDDLNLFLELSHDRMDEHWAWDWDQEIIDDEVAHVLHDIEIINKTKLPAAKTARYEKIKAAALMTTLDTVQQSLRRVQDDVEVVATKLKHGR